MSLHEINYLTLDGLRAPCVLCCRFKNLCSQFGIYIGAIKTIVVFIWCTVRAYRNCDIGTEFDNVNCPKKEFECRESAYCSGRHHLTLRYTHNNVIVYTGLRLFEKCMDYLYMVTILYCHNKIYYQICL